MSGRLDDSRLISRVDAGDMLGSIYRLADPFLNVRRFKARSSGRTGRVDDVLFVGMGGSASAGDVIFDWLGSRTGFRMMVSRGPYLPRTAGQNTIAVFLSYSGETWETLQAMRAALRTGSQVVGVGSGGSLRSILQRKGLPFAEVSRGLAPRAALGEMIVATSGVLRSLGVVGSLDRELGEAGRELSLLRRKLAVEIPVAKNRAKRLALLLADRLPIIYGFANLGSVVRRFKNQLAENAKVVAKCGLLPEACHNEIEGFDRSARPVPVIVRNWQESLVERRVVEAFSMTLRGVGGLKPLEVRERARSGLGRLLAPILFLDYVSAYLAVLRGVDPSPTPRIREYRRRYARKRSFAS